MSNAKKYIYDGWNNEHLVIELTDEEQAAKDAADALAEQEALAEEEAKRVARETKIAAYQKLGLSEAEIEAILPNPILNQPPKS